MYLKIINSILTVVMISIIIWMLCQHRLILIIVCFDLSRGMSSTTCPSSYWDAVPVCTCTSMYLYQNVPVPVCTCTSTYLYQYVPVPVCTCTSTYLYQYVPVPVCTCTSTYLYQYVPVPVCTCTSMYLYQYVPVPLCTCTSMYLYQYVPVLWRSVQTSASAVFQVLEALVVYI